MLGNTDAFANVAVKELERARKFYEARWALKSRRRSQTIAFKSGNSTLLVYRAVPAPTAPHVKWVVCRTWKLRARAQARGYLRALHIDRSVRAMSRHVDMSRLFQVRTATSEY